MTNRQAEQRKGGITGVYESDSFSLEGFGKPAHLVARGSTPSGKYFSSRPLELDENLQPIVEVDGEVAHLAAPAEKPKA